MKPRTSYILFCMDYRPKLYSKFPNMSPQDITRELGKKWKTLNKKSKKSYDIKAQQEKEKEKEKKKEEEEEKKKQEEEEEEEEEKEEEEEEEEEEHYLDYNYNYKINLGECVDWTVGLVFLFLFINSFFRKILPPQILTLPAPQILALPVPQPYQSFPVDVIRPISFSLYSFLFELLTFLALIKWI